MENNVIGPEEYVWELLGEMFGYARCSTDQQNTDRQVTKFVALGISKDNTYIDQGVSGKNLDRKEYQKLRAQLRKGDLLYLDALDRLGRNFYEIIEEWKYLTRTKNIDVVVLDNGFFDTRNFKKMREVGQLVEQSMLTTLAWVADMERKKMLRYQAEGIAEAHKRGVKFGRKKVEIDNAFAPVYERWKAGELTAVGAYNELGWKPNTFYRRVKEWEGTNDNRS